MMGRTSLMLAAAAAIAGCSTTATQPTRSPEASRDLAKALAGRTVGAALRCLPYSAGSDMQVIDDWTILFHDGRTVYLQNPRGGCPGIGSQRNTLVTRLRGGSQLCEGDISHLVDLTTGIGGGACVFGPFVPYTRPGR